MFNQFSQQNNGMNMNTPQINNNNLINSTNKNTLFENIKNENHNNITKKILTEKSKDNKQRFKQYSFIQVESKSKSKTKSKDTASPQMAAMMGFMVEPMMLLTVLMFHPFYQWICPGLVHHAQL